MAYFKFYCLICVCSSLLFACSSLDYDIVEDRYKQKILNLSGDNLITIPDSVFKFKKVEELYFGPSDLVMYGGIGNLTDKVNYLNNIPFKICKLKHLKVLDLTFNKFTTLPNLGCCDTLITLNVSFNSGLHIVDNIDAINNIKSLQNLIILGTYFTQEDLMAVKKATKATLKIIYTFDDYLKFLGIPERPRKNN